MHGLIQSLRYTVRLLRKSPGFTITAVLILGFGIGTNTAMFSLIDMVLLRPLPFPNADRLVRVFMDRENSPRTPLDYPGYLELSNSQHSFENLSCSISDNLDLTGRGDPERLSVHFVSSNLFKMTNLPFVVGRPFTENEDKPGGPLVVVLSDRLWRSRFNSDANIIGANLTLSDRSFQVIGVCRAQADVSDPSGVDLYTPLPVAAVFGYELHKRDQYILDCFGRLRDSITLTQARADLDTTQRNLRIRYPDTDNGFQIGAVPLLDSVAGNYSTTIWLVGAAVGCLLLISSANVANLLFVRALERQREMTIRAALGASRLRLIRQLLFETIVLSFQSGTFGLVIALCVIRLIKGFGPPSLFRLQEVNLDIAALIFIFAVTALISFASGLLPAWSLSKTNLGSVLKEEVGRAGTIGPRRQRIQSILVIGQVAVACVLLIGAGLLARSLQAAQNVPLGFNPHRLLTAWIYPTNVKYADLSRRRQFFDMVLEEARDLPGVADAAMNAELPFDWSWGYYAFPFRVVGRPDPEPGRGPTMVPQAISSDYFRTLQIPLLRGRDFDERDRADSQSAVIIDQALAQTFFPDQDPIGKQIEDVTPWDGRRTSTIVGVAQNSLHNHPDNDRPAPFQTYFPYGQRAIGQEFLILRCSGDPGASTAAVKKVVASVDPDVPVTQIIPFDGLIAQKYVTRRLGVFAVSLFSGAALFLSAVGLYGTLAYFVGQRTREIGVRIALGAQSSNILQLVIQQGLKLVFIGLLVGVVAALILVRFIDSVLYGVPGDDPLSLALAIVVLGLAALFACFLPALRATRINPIIALRE